MQDIREGGGAQWRSERPLGQAQAQSKAGARLQALGACIKDACGAASTSLVEHLAAQLSSLTPPAAGAAGTQHMEQALLIGKPPPHVRILLTPTAKHISSSPPETFVHGLHALST